MATCIRSAKEYADMFNNKPSMETLIKIANCFINETRELILTRKATTQKEVNDVANELYAKWAQFARQTNGMVREDGYDFVLDQLIPSYRDRRMAYRYAAEVKGCTYLQ